MKIEADEITEFVNAVKNGIAKSEENNKFVLTSNIDFELSVVTKKRGNGKINIAIAVGSGGYEKQAISKIRFTMGNQATLDRGIDAFNKLLVAFKNLDQPAPIVLPERQKSS